MTTIRITDVALPAVPVPYGSYVEVGVTWEDADYRPAQPAIENVVAEYDFERNGRAGTASLVEHLPAVPASGGLVTSDVIGATLAFTDQRPVKTVYLTTEVAVWSFLATESETPVLVLPGGLAIPLPGGTIAVTPRPPHVRTPRFGVWDGYADQRAKAPVGLQDTTAGVDLTMRQLSGAANRPPVNAAYRHYQTIRGARWVEDSAQARTARHFPIPTTVNCLWFHNTVADRYSEAGVRQLADGVFDADIRAWVASLPLDVVAYGFPLHEADLKGIGGVEAGDLTADTYRAGVHRFLEVAADEALRQGRTPANFGIGGLLTEGPLSRGVDDPWVWSRGLKPWLLDTGFPVGAWDPYFLIDRDGKREAFRPKIDRQAATYQAHGVTRLFIAETAQGLEYRHQRGTVAGTVQDQLDHLNQVDVWLKEVGEFAITFAKEEGFMSNQGSLTRPGREAAARRAFYMCRYWNTPGRITP